ncbi:MAG: hypothetical protein CVV27_08560 [Candidatus Melainabacteria bacterium HGW-Melainabacteria-1]|nr:MAG: hypothetical protein CVV27_08560 [Candidatus Melainabacteria bacterium HGW-Melainabacteria-1]
MAEQQETEKQGVESQQEISSEQMAAISNEQDLKIIEAEKKYIRATVAFDHNDIDEALMLIRTALSLCPGNPKYHYNIGYLYWVKGLLEVAVNHYKMFLRYAPEQDKDREIIKGRITFLENEIKKRHQRR